MEFKDKNEVLLTQLVLMFQTAALQHMGKIKSPFTDKIEQDLEQAQISIDMIEMIHAKMKGNLTADEDRLLSDVLKDLKLNYVDEVMKKQSSAGQATQTSSTAESGPTA